MLFSIPCSFVVQSRQQRNPLANNPSFHISSSTRPVCQASFLVRPLLANPDQRNIHSKPVGRIFLTIKPLTPNYKLLVRGNSLIQPDIIGTDYLSSRKRWSIPGSIRIVTVPHAKLALVGHNSSLDLHLLNRISNICLPRSDVWQAMCLTLHHRKNRATHLFKNIRVTFIFRRKHLSLVFRSELNTSAY